MDGLIRAGAKLVPSLTLYEVFKCVLVQRDEGAALQAVAAMQQGQVVDLDASMVLTAARVSVERGLPMADSIIPTPAAIHGAELWAQDADFKGLPGVRYRKHKAKGRAG